LIKIYIYIDWITDRMAYDSNDKKQCCKIKSLIISEE